MDRSDAEGCFEDVFAREHYDSFYNVTASFIVAYQNSPPPPGSRGVENVSILKEAPQVLTAIPTLILPSLYS